MTCGPTERVRGWAATGLDVLREIDQQVESLRRQGRQAARYRNLSGEIRKIEARIAAAGWVAAEREFTAAEAQTMGLVNRVLPDTDGELEKYVKDYADTIAGNAPITVDSVKFIVGQTLKDPDKRDLKACEDWVSRAFASNDYKEGRKAFMEKRKPAFTGS